MENFDFIKIDKLSWAMNRQKSKKKKRKFLKRKFSEGILYNG